MITIDRINQSVVSVLDNKNKNTTYHPRKRWYNKKTPKSAKRVKTMINFIYDIKKKDEHLFFVTITTCQHKSNFTDKQLFSKIGLWLRYQGVHYVSTVERQKDTTDLHFHLIILAKKKYSFVPELKKLSKYFNVDYHPALFDVKKIHSINTVIGYITKYVTKDNKKYSSIFQCRTFSVANKTSKLFKTVADNYVIKIQARTEISGSTKNFSNFLKEIKKNLGGLQLLYNQDGSIKGNDFFRCYKYSSELWEIANKYKVNHLLQT